METSPRKGPNPATVVMRILGAILALAVVFVIFVRFMFAWTGFYRTFREVSSPDGRYTITLERKSPQFPFGAQEIRISAKGKNCGKAKYETSIFHDGADMAESCVSVEFVSDFQAVVTLISEQETETVDVVFDEAGGAVRIKPR